MDICWQCCRDSRQILRCETPSEAWCCIRERNLAGFGEVYFSDVRFVFTMLCQGFGSSSGAIVDGAYLLCV